MQKSHTPGLLSLGGLVLVTVAALLADRGRRSAAPAPGCTGCDCRLCACGGTVAAYDAGACPAGCGCVVMVGASGSLVPRAVAS